jgi:hypothetical protein
MNALNRRGRLVTTLLLLALCSDLTAQTTEDSHRFIGLKAGMNHEQAEDGLTGSTRAAGVLAGLRFGPGWAGEFEIWVPGTIRDAADDDTHRDVLASLSVIRRFDGRRLRPYLLVGLSFARTTNGFTTCIADRPASPSLDSSPLVPNIVDCSEPDVRERRRDHFNSTSAYVVAGAGIEVPLWRRLRLAPELRVHVAPASVIVRPAVGLMIDF